MIERIAQVKLPVTDLAVSVVWYQRLLGLRLWVEIVEDGQLRGVGLIDQSGLFNIALRDRRVCAGQPRLDGFDVVAFTPSSRQALDELVARCDRFEIDHGRVQDIPSGSVLDIPDPDGTVLRFYHFIAPTAGFTGLEIENGRHVRTYAEPRLGVIHAPNRPGSPQEQPRS
jgi:catechol 2,3-dioxygenase-like lactoylglutathione lyase family enzyme